MAPVTDLAEPNPVSTQAIPGDSAKRRQIVEGARRIFLERGFDAASMNDIARAAGVSKGTLYVYFENKEQLFGAIVEGECASHAENVFALDPTDPDVERVLTRCGAEYARFVCSLAKASALRTVIAIADRMPEIGKVFYETGPACGIQRMADYLRAKIDSGVLRIDEPDIAAAQFLDACLATLARPVLFNALQESPTQPQIDRVVRVAVRAFLAAYRA